MDNEHLTKIRSFWEMVVAFGKDTSVKQGSSVTRILIDTCFFPDIQGWIYLSVEGMGYDVHIREMGKIGVLLLYS